MYLQKFQLVRIGAVQIFRSYHQTALLLRKFQPVIIGADQIFESLQHNCLVFAKISACDNRGSSNFQITSTKMPYFSRNFTLR